MDLNLYIVIEPIKIVRRGDLTYLHYFRVWMSQTLLGFKLCEQFLKKFGFIEMWQRQIF